MSLDSLESEDGVEENELERSITDDGSYNGVVQRADPSARVSPKADNEQFTSQSPMPETTQLRNRLRLPIPYHNEHGKQSKGYKLIQRPSI